MIMKTDLCDLLQIEYPILQGGMAWVATAELAAAVSNAGALGIIGSGQMPGDILRAEIHKLKTMTEKPYGVNIMLRSPFVREVMQVALEERVPVITTGAGNPGEYIPAFNEINTKVIPVVASVALARRLERVGITAIIAEGMESGGHVGTISTMALVPQVVDAVQVPVIAAGGIGDGRGVVAALALGAQGVQIGTRFVASTECTAHMKYKEAVLKARDRSTVVTGLSTGHPVRVVANKLTRELAEMERQGISAEEFDQKGVGKLRAAVRDGDTEYGSVMAGQISGMVHDLKPVAQIIGDIINEVPQVMSKLTSIV